MIRSRTLLLLAIAAILATAGAGVARPIDPGLEITAAEPAAPATSPTAALAIEAAACPATDPAAESLPAAVPQPDFILCSCELCKARPDVICRISPTGFSIVCSDYYAAFC